jgi:hypothetical protein
VHWKTPPSSGDSSPWQGETPLPAGRGLGAGTGRGQGSGGAGRDEGFRWAARRNALLLIAAEQPHLLCARATLTLAEAKFDGIALIDRAADDY